MGNNEEFKRELTRLLNRCSFDNKLNIRDFVLADYLIRSLDNLRIANEQENHYQKWKH